MDTLTVEEAGTVLGVTRARVCQLLRSGKLRGRKRSGIWLVDATSIRERLQRVGSGEG